MQPEADLTQPDASLRTDPQQPGARSRWLIAALAGIAASGAGLGAWSFGGVFGVRDAAALAGTIASGLALGVALGRYRAVLLASLVAAIPLSAVGVFGNPSSTSYYAGIFTLYSVMIAAGASFYVLVGGVIGVELGRRRHIGPVAGPRVVLGLLLLATVTMIGWTWFALSLRSTS